MMPLDKRDSIELTEAGHDACAGDQRPGLQLSARMQGGKLSGEAICIGCCAITVLCTVFLQLAALGYGVFVASLALHAASDARAEADEAIAAGLLPTCVWSYNQHAQTATNPGGDGTESWMGAQSDPEEGIGGEVLDRYTQEELAAMSENWEDMIHTCRMYGLLGVISLICLAVVLCALACTKSMSVDADSTMSSVPTAIGGCAACGYCCIALPQFVFMIMFWVERGNVNVIECQDNESYKEMNAVFWHSVILFIVNCLAGSIFRGLRGDNQVDAWP